MQFTFLKLADFSCIELSVQVVSSPSTFLEGRTERGDEKDGFCVLSSLQIAIIKQETSEKMQFIMRVYKDLI